MCSEDYNIKIYIIYNIFLGKLMELNAILSKHDMNSYD